MAEKKDPTLCVTCHTELPPDTKLVFFAQESLCPTRDDQGFCNEIQLMLTHMKALFDVIGYDKIDDEKTITDLGRLGYEVAKEALQRVDLMWEAQNILWQRWETARKQLREQEN